MFEAIHKKGFQVEFHSHAAAILSLDFPSAAIELEEVLLSATIPVEEIIAGGGGETKGTQRLRRGLAAKGWSMHTFKIVKTIDGAEREAVSHKMDHVKRFPSADRTNAALAIEIEWNNKDPFFDRDLENFKRLHADGAISIGFVITRGKSLHANMRELVGRFFDQRGIQSFEDLKRWGYEPTSKQRAAIQRRVERTKNPIGFRDSFIDKFVSDKFGEATTHWRKLMDRVSRGVGNPCPLVLIGLPDAIVTFGEEASQIDALIEESQD